jgi:hypothetical protein
MTNATGVHEADGSAITSVGDASVVNNTIHVRRRRWSADGPFLVPAPPSHPLIGRAGTLDDLREQVMGEARARHPCLVGLPGVGKTWLALALVYDKLVAKEFRDGILWASLGPQATKADVRCELSKWAKALNMETRALSKVTRLEEWGARIRDRVGRKRMLFVIDDAWHADMAKAFRVGGPNCVHLVSTRDRNVAAECSDGPPVRVTELSDVDGAELLERLAPQVSQVVGAAAVRDLVKSVGGLPLALQLMGKFLRVPAQSPDPGRLREAFGELGVAIRGIQGRDDAVANEAPAELEEHLWRLVRFSYERLCDKSGAALPALSLLPAKPNTFCKAAAKAVTGSDFKTLYRLADSGLVEDGRGGRYMLHQVVWTFARRRLEQGPAAAKRSAEGRLVRFYAEHMRSVAKDFPAVSAEYGNLLVSLELAEPDDASGHFVRICNSLYPYHEHSGLYAGERARELAIRATQAAERGCTAGRAGVTAAAEEARATAWLIRGRLEEKRGNYAEAARFLRQGIRVARRRKDAKRMCGLLLASGMVKIHTAPYHRVRAVWLRALNWARRADAPDPSRIAMIYERLSALEFSCGRTEEGDRYLALSRQLAGGNPNREALVSISLLMAVREFNNKDYAKADEHVTRGLAAARADGSRERIAALLHIGAAATHNRQDLEDAARWDKSKRLICEGLKLASELQHPWYKSALLNEYGELQLKQGKLKQARSASFKAHRIAFDTRSQDRQAFALFTLARISRAQAAQALVELRHEDADGLLELAQRDARDSADIFEKIGHHKAHDVREWARGLFEIPNATTLYPEVTLNQDELYPIFMPPSAEAFGGVTTVTPPFD